MDNKGVPAPVPTIVIEDMANGKKLTARDYGSNSLSPTDIATPQVPDSARSVASTAVPSTAVPLPEDESEGVNGVLGSLSEKQEPGSQSGSKSAGGRFQASTILRRLPRREAKPS